MSNINSYTSIDSPPAQYKYIYMMNLQQNPNYSKFYDLYYKMIYIINLIIVLESWIDFKKHYIKNKLSTLNIIGTTNGINERMKTIKNLILFGLP